MLSSCAASRSNNKSIVNKQLTTFQCSWYSRFHPWKKKEKWYHKVNASFKSNKLQWWKYLSEIRTHGHQYLQGIDIRQWWELNIIWDFLCLGILIRGPNFTWYILVKRKLYNKTIWKFISVANCTYSKLKNCHFFIKLTFAKLTTLKNLVNKQL